MVLWPRLPPLQRLPHRCDGEFASFHGGDDLDGAARQDDPGIGNAAPANSRQLRRLGPAVFQARDRLSPACVTPAPMSRAPIIAL
jgi:hypothetical protein